MSLTPVRAWRTASGSFASMAALSAFDMDQTLRLSPSGQIVLQHLGFARRQFSFVGPRPSVLMDSDRLIERVPLHRNAAGFADRLHHVLLALQLRRGGAGHVENMLLHDGAVEIVCPIT